MTAIKGSITSAAFAGLRWSYLGFVVRSGSNFAIGLLLARLLGPKPFGEIAIASLIIGLANVLADAGFSSALIQAPTLTDIQIRYAATMQVLTGATLTIASMFIAAPASAWFRDPGVCVVLRAIAPLFLLQAFGQTSNALMRRRLEFKTIQAVQVISYLVGYLSVGVPLAFFGAGVWSLVAAQLVQTVVYSAALYLRVRHSLLPSLDRSGGVLLRFGLKVTISNVINYGISNADNLTVGRFFGATNLGFYNRGFVLANAPSDGLVGAFQQVLFASCSRTEGRVAPIRRAYLACLGGLALLILPAFWSMSACASTLMLGLYGQKWLAAAPLFQPLVIAVSINALMALAGPVLGALSYVQREIQAQAASLVVAVFAFYLTGKYSTLPMLAWAVCGVYLFRFAAATRPTLQLLDLRWRDVLRVLAGPMLIAAITALLVGGVNRMSGLSAMQPLAAVMLLVVVGACSVLCLVLLLGRWLVPAELLELLGGVQVGFPARMARLLVAAR